MFYLNKKIMNTLLKTLITCSLALNIFLVYHFELLTYIQLGRRGARFTLAYPVAHASAPTPKLHPKLQTSVAIAGGGLSGLALALALKSSGIEDVLVIERASALRTKSQGAIRLTDAGLADLGIIYPSLPYTLRSVGAVFEQSIKKQVLENGTVNYFTGNDPSIGIGILVAWADIQDALANAIREVSSDESWLRCGSGVKSYRETSERVEVQLDDGSVIHTSLLIGGDGAFSSVRRQITSPWPDRPRSYAQTNWNAIIPRDSVPEAHRVPERTTVSISYVLSDSAASLLNVDIGRNRTFWQLRVTDEKIAKAVDSTGRGGAGLIGVQKRILELIDQAYKDTPESNFDEVRALVVASDNNIFERRILDRKPLKRWSSRRRRIVLMGDAAHAMHPAPGQGANSAFADVVALSAALKEGDLKNPAKSVKAYERARIKVANEIQASCRRAGFRQSSGKRS